MNKWILFFYLFGIAHSEACPVLIGIAGGTGSGKTTLARELQEYFSETSVLITQDSYYKDLSHLPKEERELVNFDHPDSLDFNLLREHLIFLKNGEAVFKPVYDFVTHTRTNELERVEPARLILVEGILLLAVPEVRQLFDLKIFIDTDDDVRILRRLERDIMERGRDFDSVKTQYLSTVKPMHHQFVDPSKNYADVVVWGINENFDIVTGLIEGFKGKRPPPALVD
jgi:uridine kinase